MGGRGCTVGGADTVSGRGGEGGGVLWVGRIQ